MSDAIGKNMKRRAVTAVAVLAMTASACSGAEGAATTTASRDAAVDAETTVVVSEDLATTTTVAASTAADALSPDVLAYAVESAQSLSYSFEQGVAIEFDLFGETLSASSNGPIATGVISGEDQQIAIDIGGFMESMLGSVGADTADPSLAGVIDFDALTMDTWVVDGTLVMDMSALAALEAADLESAGELELFADGPVSISLDELSEFGVDDEVAASDLVTQFAQGAQVVDPSAIVDALASVDSLTEVGNQEENGIEVTVYESTITLDEYTTALGQSIEDGASGFGSVGGLDAAAFAPLLTDVEVALQISLDNEGLVRQLVTTIDMGAFINDMLSSGAEAGDIGDLTMIVETWQTFDEYGADVEITAPEAPDVTAEIAGLLGS